MVPLHLSSRLRSTWTIDSESVSRRQRLSIAAAQFSTLVAGVSIGERVNIGPNVTIISVGHSMRVDKNSKRPSCDSEVIMSDFAWNGAGATLLYWVEI